MREFNLCTASDSYKFQHWRMYPEGTEKVYSYFESRKGAKYPSTMFFGLQYLLKNFLVGEVVTREKIDEARRRINAHLSDGAFNVNGWEYILKEHKGRLPIVIKAVPEGTVVPTDNILMSVENTDPNCYWLTNYLETLLTHVWSGSTVATLTYHAKLMLKNFLEKNSDNQEAINFMLHDFGFRGVSSFQSSMLEGAGHLINFMGTDNFPAVDMTMDYYGSDEVTAYSVPATEHSVMTALGREGEMDLLGKLLKEFPTGILSVVIDSYDYRNFVREAANRFKKEILDRDGKLVFRPDSGEPNQVTVEIYELLEENFGYTTNSKGYKKLNPKVGILWGDGISPNDMRGILFTLDVRGISAENMVFGMGGGLLQKINRDTQRFAFKSSYQERNGNGYDIFKQPLDITKTSKKGKMVLLKNDDGSYSTESTNSDRAKKEKDVLEIVFENGILVRDMKFSEVRRNAEQFI